MLLKMMFFVNTKGVIVAIMKILRESTLTRYQMSTLLEAIWLAFKSKCLKTGYLSPYDIDTRNTVTLRWEFRLELIEYFIKTYTNYEMVDISRLIGYKELNYTFDDSDVVLHQDSINF